MKKLALIILVINIFSAGIIFAQQDKNEKATEKVYLVDDFESGINWQVYNGEHSKPEWLNNDPLLSLIPGAPKNLDKKYVIDRKWYYYLHENENKYCMGVKFKMNHIGDTRKFIIPIRQIALPGICKEISFYVNGRNKKLRLRVMFKDYIGYIHTLETSPLLLDFYGWKKVVITDIDKKISQVNKFDINYKPLKIIAFVIDNPYKKIYYKPIYFYLDNLTAKCVTYNIPSYDGDNIIDKW